MIMWTMYNVYVIFSVLSHYTLK